MDIYGYLYISIISKCFNSQMHKYETLEIVYFKTCQWCHCNRASCGGCCNRASPPLSNLEEAASVRNACDLCHTISHVQSGLGVQTFKHYWLLYSRPASPSSPVSNLNPSWTPSPYLKPQCHLSLVLRLCIGALPAWAA